MRSTCERSTCDVAHLLQNTSFVKLRAVRAGPTDGRTAKRTQDALTNLNAYAMTLDAAYLRLDDRLLELANAGSGAAELQSVLREREAIGAEREAFRCAVTSLRERISRTPERSR
jgi:hypothetical protein